MALGSVTLGGVALAEVLGSVTPGLVAVGLALLVAVAPGLVAVGLALLGVVALGLVVPGVLVGAVAVGVPLAEWPGVAVPVPPGENDGGVGGGELVEHADTDAVASRARTAQPMTVPRKRRRP